MEYVETQTPHPEHHTQNYPMGIELNNHCINRQLVFYKILEHRCRALLSFSHRSISDAGRWSDSQKSSTGFRSGQTSQVLPHRLLNLFDAIYSSGRLRHCTISSITKHDFTHQLKGVAEIANLSIKWVCLHHLWTFSHFIE